MYALLLICKDVEGIVLERGVNVEKSTIEFTDRLLVVFDAELNGNTVYMIHEKVIGVWVIGLLTLLIIIVFGLVRVNVLRIEALLGFELTGVL